MGVCMSIDEDTLQIVCGPEARARHKGKKKIVMEMLNAEAKVYQILCKMPGRICTNGSTSSSCVFSKQGRKGINQDCMLVWEEFGAQANTVFCGIFDGHGPNGHLVARKVRDSVPILLALPLNFLSDANIHTACNNNCHGNKCDVDEVNSDDDEQEDSNYSMVKQNGDYSVDKPNYQLEIPAPWKKKFVTAYKLMDRNLKSHPKLNCFGSGTTAVTMIVQGKDLIIGNVGDSRAILARRLQDGSLVAHQLTTDQKPNLPGELERIRRCKGRVFALKDEPHVARVWLPHANMPGLAMARSLGDFCLKEYGLSATPQVSYIRLMEQDEFIVLASDGVWDVLSNEEAVRIVASTFPKEEAAKALVHAAMRAWKIKHGAWRTDDCTVVCHFLKDRTIPISLGDNICYNIMASHELH